MTNADDPSSCTGANTCDASGACKLKPGQSCAGAASNCASGACNDNVCCSAACAGACKTCNGSGACVAVTNADDADTCTGANTCDASGACKLKPGQSCGGAAASCASGACNENCCSAACTGTCKTCNGSGGCVSVTNGEDPDTCTGVKSCDVAGACKNKAGQICATSADCVSGVCNDGVCCGGACAGACRTCVLGTGACVTVTSADDADSCTGTSTCDATGTCKSKAGQTCVTAADCTSGVCNNGICCAGSCNGTCQKCIAGSGLCSSVTNADDPDTCTTAKTCDGTGACKQKPGQTCGGATDCASGVCQDGICCAGACSGTCKTCSAGTGACTSVVSADDPDTCTTTQTCDATGACKKKSGAAQTCGGAADCANGQCVDGYCCDSACGGGCDRCDQAGKLGTCSPVAAGDPGQPSCTPQTCDGASGLCPGSGACTSDAACGAGYFCAASGLCTAQKAQGAACNTAAAADCKGTNCRVCASGACVDGFCCNTACAGPCVACSAALKGSGADGTCGSVPADTNVRGGCAADPGYPSSCKADGLCDGSGACRQYAKSSVACGATSCNTSVVSGQLCNGAGQCVASLGQDCAPFACKAGKCATTCAVDADCTATSYCTTAKVCEPRKDPGTACAADRECTGANVCVDGVCCNSACTGQCEACDLTAHLGTCWPVADAPHGTRKACVGSTAGGASDCGGACDGSNRAQCVYPPATKSCGTSCKDDTETASTCDGQGVCVAGAPRTCAGNLACEGTTRCKTACVVGSDCTTGFTCASGKCVPAGAATCSADGTQSIPEGDAGAPHDCAPYRCGTDGHCRTGCATTDDCAQGAVCNVDTKVCAPAPETAQDSGGCTAGSQGGSGASMGAAALLAALAALSRRRRGRA